MARESRTELPPERVREILHRAAELDASATESISLDIARAAAAEAGISADSMEQALAEYFTGSRPDRVRRRGLGLRLKDAAMPVGIGIGAAVAGGLVGLGDAILHPVHTVLLLWIPLLAAGIGLVRQRLDVGRSDLLQVGFIALTAGLVAGFGSAGGDEDIFSFLVLTGAAMILLAISGTSIFGRSIDERHLQRATERRFDDTPRTTMRRLEDPA